MTGTGQGSGSAVLVPVASNLHVPVRVGEPDNLSHSRILTTRMRHRAQRYVPSIRLVYGNWYNDQGNIRGGTGEVVVSAFLQAVGESFGDARIPVTFGERERVRVAPGAAVLSDPISFAIAPGSDFFSVTIASGTGGVPLGAQTNARDGEGVAHGPPEMWRGPTTHYGYGPQQVLAADERGEGFSNVIAILGDSNGLGYGDSRGEACHFGWVQRAFDGLVPTVNLAVSGATAVGMLTEEAATWRSALLRWVRPTHAIVALGTNDLQQSGVGLEGVKSALAVYWRTAADAGMSVIACTLPPVTTSSDRWGSAEGQAPTCGWSARGRLNEWIRGCPAPLAGYLDFERVLADPSHPHRWLPGLTDDGVHLNTAGHRAVADLVSRTGGCGCAERPCLA